MSTKVRKFKLGEDFENAPIFPNSNWKASFDGTTLRLDYSDGRITNYKEFKCRRGDYVGVSPSIDGTLINIFKMRSPKDPRTKILWRHGKTSPKRIKWNNPDTFTLQSYMELESTSSYSKLVEIKNDKGVVMVASVLEKTETEVYYDHWFMHPSATIDHVKEWEKEYLAIEQQS